MDAVRYDYNMMEAQCGALQTKTMIDSLPCEFVLLDSELAVAGFNEAAYEFFRSACDLREGISFDELSGALWDMAIDGGFEEIELLTLHMRAFEECTVDYRRFDQKHYRINAKPAPGRSLWTALVFTDISDIMESERFLQTRIKELSNERAILRSRLKLADAMISEREAARIEKQFADRFSNALDCFEDALKKDNIGMGIAEVEKQREYIGHLTSGGDEGTDFAGRMQSSLAACIDNGMPKVIIHHISQPNCGQALEKEIIDAAREGVILIALFGAADCISLSLRAYEGGMELSVSTDGAVVPDFERTEQYARLKKIARRMRAKLETDTSAGFSLRLHCVFKKKAALPTALVALADTVYAGNACRLLGGGGEPMLRCVVANADIDLLKACKEYAPGLLIAEASRVVGLAAELKRRSAKMKIIAIFQPGSHVHSAAHSCVDGFLSSGIEAEGLRAAVSGVMHGLTVRADATPADHMEAAVSQYGLTEVERSIISMTGQGISSEKIAASLHYSQGSLRNMLSTIYVKLGISDRAQLTAFAIFNGFSESYQGWGTGR